MGYKVYEEMIKVFVIVKKVVVFVNMDIKCLYEGIGNVIV